MGRRATATLRLLLGVYAASQPSMAWDNGAALTPIRGWRNWNAFANDFNASLAIEVAHFLKDSGLLAAGCAYPPAALLPAPALLLVYNQLDGSSAVCRFEYLTLGGMGFAEHGDPQIVPGFPNIPAQNITRNASGHLQARSPCRYPSLPPSLPPLARCISTRSTF